MTPFSILHIPHSSTVIPAGNRARIKLSEEELDQELLLMTDRFTDELFAPPSPDFMAVQHPISRLVLDPERFLDDSLEVMAVSPRKFPSLEQVRSLVASITIETEMDRRDQALISFMLLTGMRYTAICSLPIKCLDVENQIVYQDPRQGVRTKNGKAITTLLLPFDDMMVVVIKDWVTYLSEVKEFSPSDPLFPRTRVTQAQDAGAFEANDVEPIFWKGGGSIRSILKARSEAANLSYFNPHSFRHAHVHIALKCCRTPEELKALSQNIGHEQVMTTLSSYGSLNDRRVSDVLGAIDFSGKKTHDGDIPADDVERFLRQYRRKT